MATCRRTRQNPTVAAVELLDAQLARRCTVCGGFPALPKRTVCRPCLRTRNRELHAARVARRRNGGAPGDADEEPHPALTSSGRMPRRERVGSPESAAEPAGRVNGCREPEHVEERGAGIAADELARRTGRHGVLALTGDELEAWLRDTGLARVTSAGLLVPTERGVEIANALAS